MVISRINFKSLLVAAILAGYGMYVIDYRLAGALGLFGMFPVNDGWWMLTHHVDSILFALPFAWPLVYESLPGSGWLKGLVYGFLWWLVVLLVIGSIAGALGAENLPQPGSAGGIISVILLHLVWGFLLGVLYVPAEEESVA